MTEDLQIVTGATVTVTESPVAVIVATGAAVTVNEIAVTVAVSAGQPGVGLPGGGTPGQILLKKSEAAYDTEWATPTPVVAGVSSVNGRTGGISLGPGDLYGITNSRLIGRGSIGGAGQSQEITIGNGLKLSGTTLSANNLEVMRADAAILAGTGLTGGGSLKDTDPQMAVDFAASGTSSATKAVRADDSRIAPWSLSTPTVATNLPGIPAGTVIPAGETAVQVLQRLLYPYQPVTYGGFAVSGVASVYEIGQPFPTSGTATWSISGPSANWTAGSGTVEFQRPDGSNSAIATGFNPTSLSQALTIPSITAPTNPRSANTIRLRLTGAQAQGSVSPSDLNRSWFSRWYFGKSANGDLLTPTFSIDGTGSGALLQTTAAQGPSNQTITVPAGAGFFYLFIHDGYTLSTDPPFFGIKYGGNALAKGDPTTVQVTNAYGVTATYKRYRSTFSLNDLLTLVINPTS